MYKSDVHPAFGGSGTVSVNSGTLAIDSGSLEFDGSQVLVVMPSVSLSIGGNLAGRTPNADQFTPDGSVLLDGEGTDAARQLLQAMTNDVGDSATVSRTTSPAGRWRWPTIRMSN